jgi:glycosyltransferase involved in cell wall biosynthesis
VGGTHPALIEAMGQGNIVVANITPENLEILGDAGLMYRMDDGDDLARCLQDVADNPEKYAPLREAAVDRVRKAYSWDSVVTQYESLLASLVARVTPRANHEDSKKR